MAYKIKLKPISKVKSKAEARQMAMEYQYKSSQENQSWSEVAESSNYFEKLGKKFKLTEEFKENAII